MSLEDDIVTDQILEQVETQGVASVAVSDGRVLVFSLAKLQTVVAAAENSGKRTICIFIQNPSVLN